MDFDTLNDEASSLSDVGREFYRQTREDYLKRLREADRLPADERSLRLAAQWRDYQGRVRQLFAWDRQRQQPAARTGP